VGTDTESRRHGDGGGSGQYGATWLTAKGHDSGLP
jgi:hypothetical protein